MKEEIQNRTVDKGWKSMSELLDREMPVSKRKRRFAWWWFMWLLVPMAAYGGWYWANKPGNDQPSAPTEHKSPMATNPALNQTLKNQVTITDVSKTATPQLGTSQSAQKPVSTEKTTQFFPQPNHVVDHNNSSVPNNSTQASISPQVETAHTAVLPEPNRPTIETAKPADFKDWDSFVSLPNRQQYLEINQLLPTLATIEAPSKPITQPVKSKKIAFGPSVYATTEAFRAVNGLSAGAQMKWQLNKRWAVRSGLYATRFKPTNDTEPVASLLADKYADATDLQFDVEDAFGNILGPYTGTPALDQPVLIPISTMYFLEMPLLASYQLTRRWSVQAGASTAYMLRAKSAVSNYSGSYTLALQSDQARASISDLVTAQLDQWRFDAQLGVTYALNKQLECSFFARLPIGSFSTNSAQQKQEALGGTGLNPGAYNLIGNRSSLKQPMFSIGVSYFAW